MGAIQNSMNGMLGAAAGAATLGKHMHNENLKINTEKAGLAKEIESLNVDIKNDEFEAQQAILAHAKDEGLAQDEIDKLKADPTYAQHLRETVMKESRKQGLQVASQEYDKAVSEYGKDSLVAEQASKDLNRAYERLRELNQRIDTTNKLKFNKEQAEARLAELQKKGLFR